MTHVNDLQAEQVRPHQHLSMQGRLSSDQPAGEAQSVEEAKEEAILCGTCDPEDDGLEETRAPNIAKRPYAPTKAEIEAHFPLHADFRSWCKYCMAGKAVSRQHKAKDPDEEALGVTVSIDYCFMVPEESEEEMDAILIGYDSSKMGLWAMPVDAKGPTPAAVGAQFQNRGFRI